MKGLLSILVDSRGGLCHHLQAFDSSSGTSAADPAADNLWSTGYVALSRWVSPEELDQPFTSIPFMDNTPR